MFSTILVTGASGQLGRLVVQGLIERGARRIIATTRRPELLRDFSALGVEVRYADFDEAQSLPAAFTGAECLALISTDAIGDGQRVRQHGNAVDAAKAAGIGHVVYSSGLHATTSPLRGMVADHAATEAMLARSGMRHTLLRNSFYMEMATSILGRADGEGCVPYASGAGRIGYVARADCAKAVAAALLAPDGGDRVLDITGGESFDVPELVAFAGTVWGRTLRALPVGAEELAERLVAGGMPNPMARVLAMIDVGVEKGAMDTVSGDFFALTGERQARLEGFLRREAAAKAK